jgi:hypothetical protein
MYLGLILRNSINVYFRLMMNGSSIEHKLISDPHYRPHTKFNRDPLSMKNGVFWDVTPCGSCKNRRFGST